METHPIENLMKQTMENLRNMIDVNTIVGTTIRTDDGTIIIPISKVSLGFASGGSEFDGSSEKENQNKKFPFGGGTGAGVSLKPAAFLVLKQNNVRLLPIDYQNSYDKMIDSIPQIMELFKDGLGKHVENKEEEKKEERT